MSQKTFKYSNGDVTVVWKPDVCIHSARCWKGLPGVFDPKRRPWIDMTQAESDAIINQVRQCPSGALSYFLNGQSNDDNEIIANDRPVSEEANIVQIEVTQNGPYILRTECLIKYADGKEELRKSRTSLCRCGSFSNKPFCDGSHNRIGFQG